MTMLSNSNAIEGSSSYQIANSLRLRASASAYASRAVTGTPTGGTATWTYSLWLELGAIVSSDSVLLEAGYSGNERSSFIISASQLRFDTIVGAATKLSLVTSRVLRDPSAWMHVMLVHDSNNATASDRIRMYVNGVRETAFTIATYPVLGQPSYITNNVSGGAHGIGRSSYAAVAYLDGYIAHPHLIDGQALDPSYFGQFNSDGVWTPKAYTGTYGTNGFKLDFSNGSSLTTLGNDSSGNGNNWTLTNVSLTAGATYDWMVDTPTQNYAVLNSLKIYAVSSAAGVVSAANTRFASASGASNYSAVNGSIGQSSGKWYFETTLTQLAASINNNTGIAQDDGSSSYSTVNCYFANYTSAASGTYKNSGLAQTSLTSGTAGQVLGVAYDLDNLTCAFYINGVQVGSTVTGLTAGTYFPMLFAQSNSSATSSVLDANFGQRPFAFSAPTGFKPLCTANRGTGSITTSGSFTGNANADGPFIWLNGNPESLTINGNAVTWGTHADKTAGGFKLRTASASYNASGANTYTVTVTGKLFGDIAHAPNTAKGNP